MNAHDIELQQRLIEMIAHLREKARLHADAAQELTTQADAAERSLRRWMQYTEKPHVTPEPSPIGTGENEPRITTYADARAYIRMQGRACTGREIAAGLGWKPGASRGLVWWAQKGYLIESLRADGTRIYVTPEMAASV